MFIYNMSNINILINISFPFSAGRSGPSDDPFTIFTRGAPAPSTSSRRASFLSCCLSFHLTL